MPWVFSIMLMFLIYLMTELGMVRQVVFATGVTRLLGSLRGNVHGEKRVAVVLDRHCSLHHGSCSTISFLSYLPRSQREGDGRSPYCIKVRFDMGS